MLLQKPMLGTQIDRSDSLNNPVLDLLMNEGHGDVVHDLSGYGNHGTLHGFDFPPTQTSGWNPGMGGVGINFDGNDDYISVPDSPSLNPTTAITIDVWIKPYNMDNGIGTVISKGYTGIPNTTPWMFYPDSSSSVRLYVSNGTAEFVELGTSLSDGVWCRLVGVYDGFNIKGYKNGVLTESKPYTGNLITNSQDLYIGYRWGNNYLNGMVYRARILPRAMSAFEVMQTQIDPYGMYLR